MNNKILNVLTVSVLVIGGMGMSASAQTSSNVPTKPDKKECAAPGKPSDTTTSSPVDGSKSDKPGMATAPKGSSGTDNAKTGVDPTKPGAADQTQTKK